MATIKLHIEPAFRVTIVEDSTGREWSGHSTYGKTAVDAMRKWRSALIQSGYTDLSFRADNPELVDAVSWKEPILDTSR